jgi:hypothetical protein
MEKTGIMRDVAGLPAPLDCDGTSRHGIPRSSPVVPCHPQSSPVVPRHSGAALARTQRGGALHIIESQSGEGAHSDATEDTHGCRRGSMRHRVGRGAESPESRVAQNAESRRVAQFLIINIPSRNSTEELLPSAREDPLHIEVDAGLIPGDENFANSVFLPVSFCFLFVMKENIITIEFP